MLPMQLGQVGVLQYPAVAIQQTLVDSEVAGKRRGVVVRRAAEECEELEQSVEMSVVHDRVGCKFQAGPPGRGCGGSCCRIAHRRVARSLAGPIRSRLADGSGPGPVRRGLVTGASRRTTESLEWRRDRRAARGGSGPATGPLLRPGCWVVRSAGRRTLRGEGLSGRLAAHAASSLSSSCVTSAHV